MLVCPIKYNIFFIIICNSQATSETQNEKKYILEYSYKFSTMFPVSFTFQPKVVKEIEQF